MIIPVTVTYPADMAAQEIAPEVLTDARISYNGTGSFPTGARIFRITYNGTSVLSTPYSVADKSEVLLSDILGTTATSLLGHNGQTVNWKIFVDGFTSAVTIPVKVEALAYINKDVCMSVLDTKTFSATFANVIVSPIADLTVCHPSDIVYSYTMTYPLVANNGGTQILNDSKITFWADAALTTPVSLPAGTIIQVLTPVGNTKASTLAAPAHTVYGSAIITQQPNPATNTIGYLLPLERDSKTDNWTVTIKNSSPGSVFVKVEDIALLDAEGTSYHPPYGPNGAFTPYAYDGQDFKVNYVGATGVQMAAIANISTVTSTPVIIPVTVTYPDLTAQNIDPSVLTDARISTTGLFPAGARIFKVTYNGTPVLAVPVVVGGQSEVYLSDILGGVAYPLLDENNKVNNWEFYLDGVTAPVIIPVKVEALAYVAKNECVSVMDARNFTVSLANATLAVNETATTVCGTDPMQFGVQISYPDISNLNTTVKADASISSSIDFTSGTVIHWDYNSTASGSYTIPSTTDHIMLSTIVGASYPLQGHSGTDVWSFTISNAGIMSGNVVTIDAVAVLDGVNYIHASGAVTLTVNALPVVNTVSLITSTDQFDWKPISGKLETGYEMCIDPVVSYHYFDIDALTSTETLLSSAFAQNAFYLDKTSVPSGFYTYWNGKGVNALATGWQAVMWQIINGNAPMFYISYTGSDYKLIDGLQYQAGLGEQTLQINGEYPAGDYVFNGKVTDVNGCVSESFPVKLKLNSAPVITCPGNIEVSNDLGVCGASIEFNASATGIPAPSIVYTVNGNVITSPYLFPVGTTTVTATASSICKTVTCTFEVIVNDTEKPVITLTGEATAYVCQDGSYSDAGATANDNCGGNMTASIVTGGLPVNTAVPGSYTVTYNVSDAANNPATQVTRTVIVRDMPEAEMLVNGNAVGFNYHESFCYDQTMSFALGHTMVKGAYPLQNLAWEVTFNGVKDDNLSGSSASAGADFNFGFTPATLPAGEYVMTITALTDKNGCQVSTEMLANYKATITINPEPTVAVTHDDATCNGSASGSVTLTPTPATGNYIYTLGVVSSGSQTGAYTFNGLTAGTYNWTMTNVTTTCSTSGSTIVGEPDPITLDGTINYYNNLSTPLMNIKVELQQSGIAKYPAVYTTSTGAYHFGNVCPGTYDVVITTQKSILGINATDAGQVNAWGVAGDGDDKNYPGIEKVRFLAGDVNGDLYIDSGDAAIIQKYFVTGGIGATFHKNWEFWKASDELVTTQPQTTNIPQIVIDDHAVTQNFLGMVSGEFKHRYIPTGAELTKSASILDAGNLTLHQGTNLPVTSDAIIDLPVKAVSSMQVGAISLILDYPVDKLQVESVFLKDQPDQPVMFNTFNGELRIGWYSMNPISLAEGETMLTVRLKTTSKMVENEVCNFVLNFDPLNELADGRFEVIRNASLIVDGLELKTSVTPVIDIPDHSVELLLTGYPNPFKGQANIKYTLPESGQVNLEVTSIIGNRMKVMLNNQQQAAGEYMMNLDGNILAPGVYLITLKLECPYGMLTKTIRMVKQ